MGKLSIGLCCGVLPATGLVDLIEIAARHGFSTITARPSSFAAALRRRLADAGIRVTMVDALTEGLPGLLPRESLHPSLHAYPDVMRPPDQETCLRAAEALEAPFVNVTHFGGRLLPLAEMAEAIGALCLRAGARGLRITLEFIPGTGLPDLAFAHAVARSCGEQDCRVTVDPWHHDRAGGTVADIERLPPRSISGLQMSDRIRPAPDTPYVPMAGRLMPGEGELPLPELVRAVLANSPDASLEAEVINETLMGLPPDEAAGRLSAAIRRWQEANGLPEEPLPGSQPDPQLAP
jgi:sugar phosphate isomerase/epimerase